MDHNIINVTGCKLLKALQNLVHGAFMSPKGIWVNSMGSEKP
jgi:hypothetical protein